MCSYILLRESSVMPNNTLEEKEVELEEEKELSCTRKRPKCAGSVVQSQQEIEVLAIENVNKGPGFLSLEESAYVVQSNVEANVCSQGDIRGSTTQEVTARAKLNDFCSAIGWKYPKYDFAEQGPNKNLFTCKATVHVDAITDTIVECFSESKPQKKAAREQAAQGILWCLRCLGHVK
ncbi:hypothetical protein BRADI_4g30297v3 [Brachypodium distachyon]|uniref:DRBM domain-containing protein n=1 Tax=Brachypodium distachyon TaxID=15368 RepID=A0A2K2CRB5_BRADI|nr:hypothetical protein BRADI_4g30297v3 [Brachypodium distachyon]